MSFLFTLGTSLEGEIPTPQEISRRNVSQVTRMRKHVDSRKASVQFQFRNKRRDVTFPEVGAGLKNRATPVS